MAAFARLPGNRYQAMRGRYVSQRPDDKAAVRRRTRAMPAGCAGCGPRYCGVFGGVAAGGVGCSAVGCRGVAGAVPDLSTSGR